MPAPKREMAALGNEAGTQYSLHFDPSVVTISDISGVNANPDITLGADSPAGTTLNVNAANAALGQLGIVENFSGAVDSITALPPGAQRIARVTFHVLANTTGGETKLTFDDSVVSRFTADTNGFTLGATYDEAATITIPATAGASISGRVTTPDGRGLRNATLAIVGRNGFARTVATSAFGYYTIENIALGGSYTLTVASRQYRFASRTVEASGNLTNVDFVGSE